jgi:hypothetical protein
MRVEAHIMRKPIKGQMEIAAAEQKLAAYNSKMTALFEERNNHVMDSPERQAAAEAILALWAAEG